MKPSPATGRHCLADLYGIRAKLLKDCAALEDLLIRAAMAARARVMFSRFHSFGTDMGVTGVVLLAESHISIHTWPEHGYAAADLFMCGDSDPDQALALLIEHFNPTSQEIRQIERRSSTIDARDIAGPARPDFWAVRA